MRAKLLTILHTNKDKELGQFVLKSLNIKTYNKFNVGLGSILLQD